MKKIYSILAAVAALAVAFSCAKEIDNHTEEPVVPGNEEVTTPVEVEEITISARLSDVLTKVSFNPTYSGGKPTQMDLRWEASDKLRIYDHADHTKYDDFSLKASCVGEKEGEFTGTPTNITSATSYDVEVLNASTPSYDAQTQPGDGETSALKYLASKYDITDYSDVTFDTFSSVLAITAKMPSTEVAATIESVDLTASGDIFAGGNTLSITFDTLGDADGDGILHFFATLPPVDQDIADGTELLVHFNAPGQTHDVYTRFIELGATTFTTNKLNTININATQSDKHAGLTSCDGSNAAKAYLIGDKYQMQAMSGLLVDGQTIYFKLIDDVDMTGVAWSPLSGTSTFTKGVDFNGNGKTIDNLSSTGKYASFFGVLNGSAYDVTFDHATISSSAQKAGVVAAFLGSASSSVSASCHGITVQNSSVTNSERHAGGFAGIADMLSAPLDDCHVINTTVTGKGGDAQDARVGGLLGELKAGFTCKNSTAESVTVSGSVNVGGLIGVAYGTVQNCWSSGSVSSPNTTSNCDIGLGGLVGYFENGTITKCHSSVTINQTTNGRDIGGLVGKMLAGTIEKSYATGNVTGKQRNVGGLVGLITNTSGTSAISDSYCTGTVSGNSYYGGLIGMYEKGTATIDRCYSTSNLEGGFGIGGLIGFMGAAALTMNDCAAWNSSVQAGTSSMGLANWSSGAVVGVTHPNCTIINTFRNPSMTVRAYWIPSSTYDHPDVDGSSSSTYLVRIGTDGIEANAAVTDATATNSGNTEAGRWAYHGHCVAAGTKLSTLAGTAKGSGGLGWNDEVWNFPATDPYLPTLK